MANSQKLLEFSSELLRWFRSAGLTQARLAADLEASEDIKVTGSAVGEWLRGESEPSHDKVFALERVLKAPPGTLSRTLGYDAPLAARQVATRRWRAGERPEQPDPPEPEPIQIAAQGVVLNELAELDPEAYQAIMRQAEIALDRARDRRPS